MFIHEKTGRQFDTLEVLAVAYAAQRINKGYLKFTSYDYHKNILHNRANKEIVKNHFASWRNPKDENLDRPDFGAGGSQEGLGYRKKKTPGPGSSSRARGTRISTLPTPRRG